LARRKRFHVEFTAGADRDLHSIHDLINQDRPHAAARWLRELQKRVNLLETMPLGFEIIPEAADLALPLRHVLYGNYRIIYLVTENRVSIVRIVHASRHLTPNLLELPSPTEEPDEPGQ
jgi:plasmid stabilization system protein ParE